MLFSGWMVETAVAPHQECYSAIKVDELLIHAATWVESKGFMLSEKKIISEGYILCESIYTTIDTQNNSGGTQENYAKTTKANFFLHRALKQETRESSC